MLGSLKSGKIESLEDFWELSARHCKPEQKCLTEKKVVCLFSEYLVVGKIETIVNQEGNYPGRSTGQSVKQASGIVTVTEGKHLSLSCSYEGQFSSSAYRYTYWYIQHPGQPLKLLLSQYKKDSQGFYATHLKGEKNGTYNLEKDASQLKDSAVYFCAFSETQ
ncbi:hypothetical protein Chor_009614 [Crotalus horridus]